VPSLKQTGLATAAAAALLALPVTPAAAAGPLLFAPLFLGRHVLGAVARLATLPLIAASVGASESPPPASYAAPRGYYAPPNYYARPAGYYPAPQVYYPPVVSYARSMPRYYAAPRSYYAPPARYAAPYGSQVFYRSRGIAYRRR
jgi:hypothetical protein